MTVELMRKDVTVELMRQSQSGGTCFLFQPWLRSSVAQSCSVFTKLGCSRHISPQSQVPQTTPRFVRLHLRHNSRIQHSAKGVMLSGGQTTTLCRNGKRCSAILCGISPAGRCTRPKKKALVIVPPTHKCSDEASSFFIIMTIDEHEQFPTHNEFRSDTFTVPTASMNAAVIKALTDGSLRLGDSVYKEDHMTLELESKMCDLTGKPAALFCASGTMSNQIGLRANLVQPPYSILCDYRAHVFLHEAGGLASLSQAMVHPVVPANGLYLTLEDIAENFTPSDGDIHAAPTKVISLENTLHGMIMPIEEIRRISKFAKDHGLRLHLDGARLFNASVETGVALEEYCSHFDSVSLCLSKSLGAPMGSVLVGEQKFIDKANHFKKQVGGGIRQSGIMALMAIIALDENFSKIRTAHQYARDVGRFCAENDIALELPVESNFVFVDVKKNKMDDSLLAELGEKHNVKLMGGRLAFHFQLSRESVDNLKHVLLECKKEALRNPFVGSRCNKQMYNIDVIKKLQQRQY